MQILDYSSILSSNSPIISPFPSRTKRTELKVKANNNSISRAGT